MSHFHVGTSAHSTWNSMKIWQISNLQWRKSIFFFQQGLSHYRTTHVCKWYFKSNVGMIQGWWPGHVTGMRILPLLSLIPHVTINQSSKSRLLMVRKCIEEIPQNTARCQHLINQNFNMFSRSPPRHLCRRECNIKARVATRLYVQ